MIFHGCKNFTELLEMRRPDFPQAIVAGWMTPDGQIVSAAATACEKHPTEGEMAVAWAGCLAACFKRIDELCAKDPKMKEGILQLVEMTVGGLDVVGRMKNDLAKLGTISAGKTAKGATA